MPKKLKDTDYLSISARVRAMENGLLTRERMERMLEARSVEEAAKVLAECGYGEMNSFTPAALDERLSEARDAVYQDLQGAVPDPNVIDVFRIKYDYHNAKVLLKAEAMGLDPVRLLVGGGRYAAAALQEDFQRDDLRECSDAFRDYIRGNREVSKKLKETIYKVTRISCGIGPYEPPQQDTQDPAGVSVDQTLQTMQALGVDVQIEEK